MTRDKMIRKRRRGGIAVAVAAAMLAILLPARASYALDLTEEGAIRQGSIKVDGSSFAGLADEAVFDVYQVAKAVPVSGYDAYEFDFASEMSGAETYYEQNIKNSEQIEASTLAAFTQISAKAAKDGILNPYNGTALSIGTDANAGTVVDAGMYLVILHDKDSSEEYWPESDAEDIITEARGEDKTFSFAPILVSVPNRLEKTDAGAVTYVSGTTVFSGTTSYAKTSDSSEWEYDITVTPKAGVEEEGIPIEITKTIDTFDGTAEAVTFVFEVKAEKTIEVNGESVTKTVYDNVHAIEFDSNTGLTRSVTLRDEFTGEEIKVPKGSVVTITERDPGATYSVVGESTKQAEEGETAYTATFQNRYEETPKSGGAAVNGVHVVPDSSGTYGWVITPVEAE